MTSLQCGGGTRGLAGLPQASAEVPEGHFSGSKVRPEKLGVGEVPKPQGGLPSL